MKIAARATARLALVACSTLALSLSLTACGLAGDSNSPGNEAGAIPKPDVDCEVPAQNVNADKIDTSKLSGEIRFATQGLKKDFGGFFNPLIAKFEQDHPGTKIVWEDTPTAEDFDARMVSDARTCVMADVINVPSQTIMALTKGNLLLDFDVKAPGIGGTFLPDVWSQLDIGANGHHTALPWYWGPSVVTYNTDLFVKAGLDPNKPPKTIDELFAYSKQVAEKSGGQFQALWGNALWTFVDQWYGMGVEIMNSSDSEFVFADDENARKWLTGMAELYKLGAIPKDSVTGKPDPGQAYNNGTLVFGSANASFLRNVKKNAPALYPKTAVGPTLHAPGQNVLFSGQYVTVAVTTKNAPLALAFADYVTNAENQLAWCQDPNVVIFPSATEALDDPFFTQTTGDDPLAKARVVAAESAKDAKASKAAFYITGKIRSTLMQQIQLAITGQKDPKAALTDAQTEANRLLASLR